MSKQKHIVLLGNSGFIGTAIEREVLLSLPDCKYHGFSSSQCDLCVASELDPVSRLLTSETIVIFASGIKRQFGDSLEVFQKNIQMVVNFGTMLKCSPVKRVIFLSSAAVYGEECQNLAIDEDTPIQPLTLYGTAKFACERILLRVADEISASLVLLRPPLVYGRGDSSCGYGPAGFEESVLTTGRIELWGDGTEQREFVYVEDLARIVGGCILNEWAGTLNPVSGKSRTYRDCAAIILRHFSLENRIFEKPRSKSKVDHQFNPTKLQMVLPEFQFTSLEEGLKEMLMCNQTSKGS